VRRFDTVSDGTFLRWCLRTHYASASTRHLILCLLAE
jgi:hypothetical protein